MGTSTSVNSWARGFDDSGFIHDWSGMKAAGEGTMPDVDKTGFIQRSVLVERAGALSVTQFVALYRAPALLVRDSEEVQRLEPDDSKSSAAINFVTLASTERRANAAIRSFGE